MGKKADSFGFYQRGRRGAWYTTDPVTGKPASTRCTDLAAAKLWRATRERVAANPAIAAAQTATLGDECRMMVDARAALGKSTDYYERQLGHWTRILGNDFPLSEVGPAAFDRFIATRRGEGVVNHTISHGIKVMITTLRNAKRAGRWVGDLEVLRPHGFSAGYVPRTRTLTVAELGALLNELPPEGCAFVMVCVGLGLRRGEALALRPEHVDVDAWLVQVPGTKTAGARRVLPVLAPFRPFIAAAVPYLPFSRWAKWVVSGWYTRYLDAACRLAGIPRCTPNDLRRTHATLLGNSGVAAETARALLGHTRGSQLLEQVYDKPTPLALAARAGKLEGLTAELAPFSKSLQAGPGSGDFTEQNATRETPWGRSSYPAGGAPQVLSSTSETETGRNEPSAGEESLQARLAIELALAARAALHGGKPGPSVHWLTAVRKGRRDHG
jgi:integrase